MMTKRKNPPCLGRGILWLFLLFITLVAVLSWAEALILPVTAEAASPALAHLVGVVLNLTVFVLFAAITTRTEIAALPAVKETPTVPDLVSSDEDLL
jgi:hypothetical protein